MAAPIRQTPLRRERRRNSIPAIDGQKKQDIVQRVVDFYNDDDEARTDDRRMRLQRYAKYRQWTEGRDWPWQDSSDIALPDLTTNSLNTQDTLHNAVMSNRPVVSARAIEPHDEPKQRTLDTLIDSQVFIEQDGERTLGEFIESFVNDPVATAFIPWVKENRQVTDVKTFPPIPSQLIPLEYFRDLLSQVFTQSQPEKQDDEGWDWIVDDAGREIEVRFYTDETDDVEMVIRKDIRVYDGPKIIVKDYDDVYYPPRSANLQIPGPSNPGGAAHVILVDRPTVDEIKNLSRPGPGGERPFYDLIEKEDLEALETVPRDDSKEDTKDQTATLQGEHEAHEPRDKTHKPLTRLMCFDLYDVDDDGVNEDMIWWIILETKTLAKAALLTEFYPVPKGGAPRRPLASASFLPVKGFHAGISLLELGEGLHDFSKQLLDQMFDAGTLANSPFFFYRASSNIKQEVFRMWPGDGMPLNDPKNDVFFPNLSSNIGQAFGINMFTLLTQMSEKLTLQGDLQSGRVPQGKASALRTLGGIQTILAQGESRPERILRRFFMGLVDIYRQIHSLNQSFLPEGKKFRIAGIQQPGEDPYATVEGQDDIAGAFAFDFNANAFNASKQAIQQALGQMATFLVSEIAINTGISTPETLYRFFRDWSQSFGQNPDNYMQEPVPGARLPRITWEEAVSTIMDSQAPVGMPIEGAQAHFAGLQGFMQTDQFGLLTGDQPQIFRAYLEKVADMMRAEQQQQQLAQAAASFGGPQGQAGAAPPPQEPTMVSPNELLPEDLPTSGGGAAGVG
jgi:hypothetical protein